MKTALNTENLDVAFSYKDNTDLKFTYYIFKILQYPKLLKTLTAITNGILKYNLPFKFFIRKTVFKIFCAGENIDEAFGLIKRLRGYKVKAVLDYVSEGEKTHEAFERNAAIIVENIKRVGKEAPDNYVSVKVSGLEDPAFLGEINKQVGNADFRNKRYEELVQRLDRICKAAAESGVTVFIDAEDRYFQDTLDNLTETMMERYNKHEVVVFNTLQMYLIDRPQYIEHLIESGKQKNYIPGIKLVRGAYVEKEREAAQRENRQSPVYATKEETDAAFNKGVERCLSMYPSVSTCVATHNDKSTVLAAECMKRFGIDKQKVKFSQLYGMSDNLTFNLAAEGYNTSKYLPYGEVKKAIPYLVRRAEENSSINGQLSRELGMLRAEVSRRKSKHKV